MAEKQNIAYRFFIDKGLSPIQSAAIVGNIVHESNMNPQARSKNDAGPGKDSVGLVQWNRGRLQNLTNFAKNNRGTDIYDFQTQLEFVWHELNTSHKPVLTQLKKSTSLDDAVHIVNRHYEVSADSMGGNDPTHVKARQNRLGHASGLLRSQGISHSIMPSKYSGNRVIHVAGDNEEGEEVDDMDFWNLLSFQPEYTESEEEDDYYRDLYLATLIRESTEEYQTSPTELDETKDDADALSAYNSLNDQNNFNAMMMTLIMSAQLPEISRTNPTNL